jgi:hypothetical protein
MSKLTNIPLWSIFVWLSVCQAHADDFFETQIEPLLERRCFECHSHQGSINGGLALDSKSGWEQGGDLGPTIVAGNPEESLLIQAVRWSDSDLQMPPDGRLPEAEIALLEEWVRRGAPDPRELQAPPDSTNWWSLKRLARPDVPDGTAPHPIDRFIHARLSEEKLAASPEADRRTLIRRLMFDLHGLPPTHAEVRAFTEDADPEAYQNLVDRLLNSPRYGERWARHWLDTIHFAETHGCGHDLPRDEAWRYRDYVIDSLNADKPWSQFIREQLAADHFFPEDPDLTVALGFLAAGVFDHSAYETAPINFDYLDRDDLVTQTMGAFASTTASCARCHAHKFDPITQEDYYALQAVFAGILEGNVPYDQDNSIAEQRRYWLGLRTAAESRERGRLLSSDLTAVIEDWEKRRPLPADWAPLGYESFTSTEGANLRRYEDVIISEGPRPDKDTYVVSGATALPQVTAIRLEVLADESLPMGGPGRQDNGNLTLSEFKVQWFSASAQQPVDVAMSQATADFNQDDWSIELAIDGKSGNGWGIYPAVGRSHYAVFELSEPLVVDSGGRLVITLKQHAGGSHLIGRFRLCVTGDPADRTRALPEDVEEALKIPADQRDEEQKLAVAAHAIGMVAGQSLQHLPAPSMVYAAASKAEVLLAVGKGTPREVPSPKPVHLLRRGDFDKPVREVTSGTLSAVEWLPSRFEAAHSQGESERRAALADWLADQENPLTWRSIANRLWHYHFGRGLCDFPNDFGRMGGTPSHPELLDWLACELRDQGGSLKHLHRLIVTSAAYRQSSEFREQPARIDSHNRLLWRMNRRRLDADSYRDFALATADRLDLAMGGPSVRQFVTGPPVQLTPTLDYSAYDWSSLPAHRRSIYRFVWRGIPDPFMETLDFPDLGMLAPTRGFTASAMQSLALYNNQFVLHFSQELGKQLSSPDDAVRRILLREPTAEESAAFGGYAANHGLGGLCRVLFNSNEFLFVN